MSATPPQVRPELPWEEWPEKDKQRAQKCYQEVARQKLIWRGAVVFLFNQPSRHFRWLEVTTSDRLIEEFHSQKIDLTRGVSKTDKGKTIEIRFNSKEKPILCAVLCRYAYGMLSLLTLLLPHVFTFYLYPTGVQEGYLNYFCQAWNNLMARKKDLKTAADRNLMFLQLCSSSYDEIVPEWSFVQLDQDRKPVFEVLPTQEEMDNAPDLRIYTRPETTGVNVSPGNKCSKPERRFTVYIYIHRLHRLPQSRQQQQQQRHLLRQGAHRQKQKSEV